ncbi:hypothetical protein GA840_00865 [Pediococcus ethanolidurans]|uniref:hypothetical protein n=1 Tax=Pediococcus ethanolidurans TaxID=319653 RepID=UPI00295367F4|nr:hypothetical protein [Pediococcus ethanolidurans]MDV7718438.1 hypothetical protein [Pediococcus ethanolidurans]
MIHKLSKKQVNILKQWYIWQLTIGFVTYIGVLVSRALSKQHASLSSRQLVVIIISFVVMGLAIKIPFEKALEPS